MDADLDLDGTREELLHWDLDWGVAVYVMSFVLIVNWTLLQVCFFFATGALIGALLFISCRLFLVNNWSQLLARVLTACFSPC